MFYSKDNVFYEYLLIIIGTIFMAIALNIFLEPNNIVTGGVTGLAIIIAHLSNNIIGEEIPLWLTNIVLNIPLFLVTIKVFGVKFLKRTLFATIFLSVSLYFTSWFSKIEVDNTLASVFGGVLCGIGLGLIFRSSATTGGTDLAASIIHKYIKHYSISKIMFFIDVIIIAAGFFVFGSIATMYAIISVFIISKVIDAILEGLSFAKAAFIISEKYDEIAKEIMYKLDRGATSIYGKGMYTKKELNIILCVVSQKEIVTLKEITSNVDPNAFVIVADVREALGEGFRDIN